MIKFSKFILLLIIFIPSIPLIAIDGIGSTLRVDYLLGIFFIFLFIASIKITSKYKITEVKLLIILISIYILRSNSFIISVGQLINYFSFFLSFLIGFLYLKNDASLLKLLSSLLFLNILAHFFSVYFDFQVTNNFINGLGQDESDILFGQFGISKMPFQFVLYVASFFFLNLLFRPSVIRLFLLLLISLCALLTGESRIGLGAFICSVFFLYPLACFFIVLPALAIFPITEKMSNFLAFNGDGIFVDPSLGMRLNNFLNYLDWLTPARFLFGGGAQSHLDFTNTYGLPGALDIFYLRLFVEFGLFGILCIGYLVLRYLFGFYYLRNLYYSKILFAWLIFLGIYSIFNEGLIASRSGHLTFLITGIIFSFSRERREN